jgi:hypothetical protein
MDLPAEIVKEIKVSRIPVVAAREKRTASS